MLNPTAYREAISINKMKSNIVILVYLMIYLSIGLLVDIILLNPSSFSEGFSLLLSGYKLPIATIILGGIGVLGVFLVMTFGEKIFLSGSEYNILDPNSDLSHDERTLCNIVEELSIAAGLRYVPRVCLIDADYMNAFATGWSEKSALVAITTKLFDRLNRDEIAAVMAHELTHIRNADVRLTLVIGVLTNIMLLVVNIFVRIFMFSKEKKGPAAIAMTILFVLQFILPFITMFLQMFLSRKREYMADAGAVALTHDPESMANALRKISNDYDEGYKDTDVTADMRKSAYIFGPDSLFSTHPSLKGRLESLGVL